MSYPKFLKEFKFPDWVSLVSCIGTITGVIVAVRQTAAPQNDIQWWTFVYLATLLLFFVVANFFAAYLLHRNSRILEKVRRKRLREFHLFNKARRKQKQVAKFANRINNGFAAYEAVVDGIRERMTARLNGNERKALCSELVRESQVHLKSVLDEIANLFSVLSGERCAACIKIRAGPDVSSEPFSSEKLEFVATMWRDRESRENRTYDDSGTLALYRHTENTAFLDILQSAHTDFYGCDDLAANKHYRNLNTNRDKYYNAVAVHAIRRPNSQRNDDAGVVAFLCIDNFGGKLSSTLIEQVLGMLSWQCYTFLRYLCTTHKALTSGGGIRHELARKP